MRIKPLETQNRVLKKIILKSFRGQGLADCNHMIMIIDYNQIIINLIKTIKMVD